MQKWIDYTTTSILAERDRVGETSSVRYDRIVDTLAHIWLTSIYGESQ
jgi:hypothetical protein